MYIINAIITEAIATTIELLCNSYHVGQLTLFINSSYELFIYETFFIIFILYVYARVERLELPANGFGDHYSTNWATPVYTAIGRRLPSFITDKTMFFYSIIEVICPAPTVLPPSLIANRNPSVIATLFINSTVIVKLSPGITISVPSGNWISPVTSVVLK